MSRSAANENARSGLQLDNLIMYIYTLQNVKYPWALQPGTLRSYDNSRYMWDPKPNQYHAYSSLIDNLEKLINECDVKPYLKITSVDQLIGLLKECLRKEKVGITANSTKGLRKSIEEVIENPKIVHDLLHATWGNALKHMRPRLQEIQEEEEKEYNTYGYTSNNNANSNISGSDLYNTINSLYTTTGNQGKMLWNNGTPNINNYTAVMNNIIPRSHVQYFFATSTLISLYAGGNGVEEIEGEMTRGLRMPLIHDILKYIDNGNGNINKQKAVHKSKLEESLNEIRAIPGGINATRAKKRFNKAARKTARRNKRRAANAASAESVMPSNSNNNSNNYNNYNNRNGPNALGR